MAKSKQLFDKRSQDRQTQRSGAPARLYRQMFTTLSLVARAMTRFVSRGVSALVSRLKLLALPEGPRSVATMLAKGVEARLGSGPAAAVYRGQVRL